MKRKAVEQWLSQQKCSHFHSSYSQPKRYRQTPVTPLLKQLVQPGTVLPVYIEASQRNNKTECGPGSLTVTKVNKGIRGRLSCGGLALYERQRKKLEGGSSKDGTIYLQQCALAPCGNFFFDRGSVLVSTNPFILARFQLMDELRQRLSKVLVELIQTFLVWEDLTDSLVDRHYAREKDWVICEYHYWNRGQYLST